MGACPCENGGTCVENTCECIAGFGGESCETMEDCFLVQAALHAELGRLINPCLNGGTCSPSGECICPITATGSMCETIVDPCSFDNSPCQNGATCSVVSNSVICTCAPGFQGTDCSIEVQPCSPNPCLNSGTCVVTGPESFKCECPVGWSGDDCSTVADPCDASPCENGGTCSSLGPGTPYSCSCAPGFTGSTCSLGLSACVCVCACGYMCVGAWDGLVLLQLRVCMCVHVCLCVLFVCLFVVRLCACACGCPRLKTVLAKAHTHLPHPSCLLQHAATAIAPCARAATFRSVWSATSLSTCTTKSALCSAQTAWWLTLSVPCLPPVSLRHPESVVVSTCGMAISCTSFPLTQLASFLAQFLSIQTSVVPRSTFSHGSWPFATIDVCCVACAFPRFLDSVDGHTQPGWPLLPPDGACV